MKVRGGLAAVAGVVVVGVMSAACGSGGGERASGNPVPTTSPEAAPIASQDSQGESAGRPFFTDVATDVGLDFTHGAFRWGVLADPVAMMGGGICWLDFDNDGWLDLFAVNSHAVAEAARWRNEEGDLPRSALFRNVGGEFVDVSSESGADLAIRGNGCVAADFNLDGNTDIYVTAAGVSALLWNNGDGTFTEGAQGAGATAGGWYTTAAVADVNGNGWPDLFVGGYADLNTPVPEATQGFPLNHLGVRNLLYLNEGPGDDDRVTFREVGVDAGLESAEPADFEHALGAVFTDVDGDGNLDLYVANDASPNRLYMNVPWEGGVDADPLGFGFRFDEVGEQAGVDDPNAGMGVTAGDYDGDGRPDLVQTNAHRQPHGAFRSQDPGPDTTGPSFVEVGAELGVDQGEFTGWGLSWADLTHDGHLDLFLVNGHVPVTDLAADAEPLQVFMNLSADGATGKFSERGDALGLDEVGLLNARGSAVADFDNDGSLDVAINSIGGPLVLLRNDGAAGHWLTVQLDRFDPGAVVTATLPDGRELVREARAGSSYLASEDPRLHFGLGDAQEVAQVEVRWTDGTQTVHRDVAADQVLVIDP